jgi:hypothetical protein
MRKSRFRPKLQTVALKKPSRVLIWSPPIRGVGSTVTATHSRSLPRFRNGLAFGFALAVLGFAATVALSRFHPWLDDWLRNDIPWFDPALWLLTILSITACLWTWRDSRWSRATPLILILSWAIIYASEIGTW